MLTWFIQPILTIWFNAEHILLFLHQDPEVAHLAMIYLRYVSLGAPGMQAANINGAIANYNSLQSLRL